MEKALAMTTLKINNQSSSTRDRKRDYELSVECSLLFRLPEEPCINTVNVKQNTRNNKPHYKRGWGE